MGPFEASKDIVALLQDEQLRTLLDKLLTAEAMVRGISPASIAVGGNQTAGDGGVDASIGWRGQPAPRNWLPRRTIYFQCKAEKMGPAKLTKELRPGGDARPIFGELAHKRGAYIVFSTDDPSKSGYDSRIAAMRAALADVKSNDKIALDFYGADKIARWVKEHIGVTVWLLERVGRPLIGWRPYGSWSAPDAAGGAYAFDESSRAQVDGISGDIKVAVSVMRRILAEPGGAVRLIGLSGMGKTRLAEALFDERLDALSALPTSHAIYADAGLELAVGAAQLTEQVATSGAHAVIVVDNCTAQTHGQLAEIVKRRHSRASLLTIDFDVGGEKSAGTVVTLGENSELVLQSVLAERAPRLSDAERRHLAEFSGGNARIVLKLAEAGGSGVDLSKLNDGQLLDRLFQSGRVECDHTARGCAEAASLVYAFYVSDGDGQGAEHAVLAGIAGVDVDVDAFYRQIATFLDWGMVQKRGPQRAVMPPPLANMLAAPYVRRSDPNTLMARFVAGPPRLLASFARRIGQLHDEPTAVAIAERLLAADGPLGRPEELNETLRRGFVKAAPAAPDAALAAIERTLAGPNRMTMLASENEDRRDYLQLLVLIGHDPALFDRVIQALVAFAIADGDGREELRGKNHLLERFWPMLSFTLADQETRLANIDRMLGDQDKRVRALGVEALDHMLDANHFNSSLNLEFGARSRLTEWRPYNGAGYEPWFAAAYERLERVTGAGGTDAGRAREIIAGHVREHLDTGFGDLSLAVMRAVAGNHYWEGGWRAVNDALHFASRRPEAGDLSALGALEQALRPRSLDDMFEAFVLGEPWRHWHPAGRQERPLRNVGLLARAVGRAVAHQGGDLAPWLERAGLGKGQNSAWQFAVGMSQASADLDTLWASARAQVSKHGLDTYNSAILGGILEGGRAKHRSWVNARLDEVAADPVLADHLVVLHSAVPLDADAITRFSGALASGAITPQRFSSWMGGGVTKPVPAPLLAGFLRELHAHDDGVLPALEVLQMRVYGDRMDKVAVHPALIEVGRSFLVDRRTYTEKVARQDHGLTVVAKLALKGDEGLATAVAICRALRQPDKQNRHSLRDFDELAALMMKLYPRVVLDEIVSQTEDEYLVGQFFGGWSRNNEDFDATAVGMDYGVMMEWVSEEAATRAVKLAYFTPYAEPHPETGTLQWTKIARDLIAAVRDPTPVLNLFEQRFFSGGGSGPISLRFVRRRPLVAAFKDDHDWRIAGWAAAAGRRLEESVRRWDKADQDQDSRFE